MLKVARGWGAAERKRALDEWGWLALSSASLPVCARLPKQRGDQRTVIELSLHAGLKRLSFSQRTRIIVFRWLGVVFVPLTLFIRPYFDDAVLGGFLEQIGVMLIITCVLGRCWAMLYIGGNKNDRLTTKGPYSVCRNPLYVFSLLGVAGCGFMIQSLIYTVLLTSVTFIILFQAVRNEERYLADKFAEDYVTYRNSTPRFAPVNFRTFQSEPVVQVNVSTLKRCFRDATLFILAIPVLELVEWLQQVNAVGTFVLF